MNNWGDVIEELRTKAPKVDGLCRSCGQCMEHPGDEHLRDCAWANQTVAQWKVDSANSVNS